MTSEDQALNQQSTNDQSQEVKGDKAEGQSQSFEVNGQKLTGVELLDNYKKLQGEYTKSRQELSETKKNSDLSDEDKKALEFIKENGFVTRDDLENMTKRQAHESKLSDIIANNPDLKPFEAAIREIGKDGSMAYEDIIQKYGFKSKDKLSKAKSQGDIKGTPEERAKNISEMSMAEYEKYKVKMGWNKSGRFS